MMRGVLEALAIELRSEGAHVFKIERGFRDD